MKNLLWCSFVMVLLLFSCDNSSQAKNDDDSKIPTDSDITDDGSEGEIDNPSIDDRDTATTDDIIEQDKADESATDSMDSTYIEDDDAIEVEDDLGSDDGDISFDDKEATETDISIAESDNIQQDDNDTSATDIDEQTDTDISDELPDSDGRYVIIDEAVLDNTWDLMWQKGNSDYINHFDAITYCENLSLNGWNDWRLPTISELRTIIEGCYYTIPNTGYCEVYDSCLSQSCDDSGISNECNCSGNLGPAGDGGYCEPGVWDNCAIQLWSASIVYDHDPYAWVIYYFAAWVKEWNRYQATSQARCVRDI